MCSCCPGVLLVVLSFNLKDIPVFMVSYMLSLLMCHGYKTGFYFIGEEELLGKR